MEHNDVLTFVKSEEPPQKKTKPTTLQLLAKIEHFEHYQDLFYNQLKLLFDEKKITCEFDTSAGWCNNLYIFSKDIIKTPIEIVAAILKIYPNLAKIDLHIEINRHVHCNITLYYNVGDRGLPLNEQEARLWHDIKERHKEHQKNMNEIIFDAVYTSISDFNLTSYQSKLSQKGLEQAGINFMWNKKGNFIYNYSISICKDPPYSDQYKSQEEIICEIMNVAFGNEMSELDDEKVYNLHAFLHTFKKVKGEDDQILYYTFEFPVPVKKSKCVK